MGRRVLVVGGTGPTGVPIVKGLLARGHDVTIVHRGTHEDPEIEHLVRHVHADPYQADQIEAVMAAQGTVDVVVAMYGRLRAVAAAAIGRTEQFVSVGGVPAVKGWMNPFVHEPHGLPVPVSEDAPTVDDPEFDAKGYRVARTEEKVFELHPNAAHIRYPYVYGPRQLVPREWTIVRRVLDGRRRVIVADNGLTLHHHGYTENLAHAVLLAVDQPERCAGRLYNAGDDEVLTVRQVVELIATALGVELEIVSMPWDLALPARPLLAQPSPTHRVLDLGRIRADLGYCDVVPAREAIGRTAHWLTEHRPEPGGLEETVLTDPFDYAAEDNLIEAWTTARRALVHAVDNAGFSTPPGYGLAYSGPGGRPRTQEVFEQ